MLRFCTFLFSATLLFACNHAAENKFYGNEFDTTQAISVAELVKRMEGNKKVEAIVYGNVTAVCKAEGCWMNLENPGHADLFVDWNHEFNIPLNGEGTKAFVTGYAFYDITTVEELKHFAKDEGKTDEEIANISEPEFKIAFKATGVKL
ncbi:MAG: DUF4920 domain-containing protein [Chitinophagales bacterium]|nr:DUF4920 domain-containing protein [Chitinophagales bacterium]